MHDQIVAILHKCINGIALTEIEKKQLEDWKNKSSHNLSLYNEIMNSDDFGREVKEMLSYDSKNLWSKINRELHPKQSSNKIIFLFRHPAFRYAAAVILLILISTAIYMFTNPAHDKQQQVASNKLPVHDVAPGMQQAVLTLADGKTLVLDNASNGTIATQGNTTVLKEDGLLAYNSDNDKPQTEVLYNTITTPRAGYYSSLVLADGSKVWLNALSSIRFPTTFTGKDRVVEITGEAYFEVAKNPSRPFKVIVNRSSENAGKEIVEVLGTHFNINSYSDEASIKTTLFEGAIKISAAGKTSFLKPGQQGVLRVAQNDNQNELKVIDDADMDEAIAWKNQAFIFKKQDIATIMRQVARWYDVQVVFEDKITEPFVVTNLSRNVPVSKLLKILEMAGGVHFEIDDANKKIIVRH
jgi:transmembrane sensor